MQHKQKIIIGNWKMQLTLKESVLLTKDILKRVEENAALDVVVCPSFTALPSVGPLLDKGVALGAQDVFWEEKGAYTGAIAPRLLTELGCRYVIVGHSERRAHGGETDAIVAKKVHAVLAGGLIPILCVGETAEERREGRKDHVVMQQVTQALLGATLIGTQQLIIAYEPVWVIGSGQAVTGEDAEHMAQVIRHTLHDIFSPERIERSCRVLYGGSVEAKNVRTFTERTVIDGVLVGGASVKAASFLALIDAMTRKT